MSINMADLDFCIEELEKANPATKYVISVEYMLEIANLAKIGLYHVRKDYLTEKALKPNSPLAPAYFDAEGRPVILSFSEWMQKIHEEALKPENPK